MAVESFASSVLEKQGQEEEEEVGLVVVKKDLVGLKVWREWKFGVWIVRAETAIVFMVFVYCHTLLDCVKLSEWIFEGL